MRKVSTGEKVVHSSSSGGVDLVNNCFFGCIGSMPYKKKLCTQLQERKVDERSRKRLVDVDSTQSR